VNERILADEPVRAYETSLEEAQRMGAIMFFGEKYGDVVRVVEAGERSTELCGGTHVAALGMIGPFKIVSEGSIGANTRRIEAVTGFGALERFRREEEILARAAELLKVRPDEVAERVERELEARRELEAELRELRRQVAGAEAAALAAQASDGLVVARRDGRSAAELRELALAVRERPGVRAVVLGGAAPGGGAALVAAVAPGSGLHAGELLAEAARAVGGGSGRQPDVAVAGGKDAGRIDEALELARAAALAAAR
jgi:alanyl-tRNA synthetase